MHYEYSEKADKGGLLLPLSAQLTLAGIQSNSCRESIYRCITDPLRLTEW